MQQTAAPHSRGVQFTVPPPPPQHGAARRRTLGVCAHCRKPVDVTDEYVRLYRRAWHLDCALASEPAGDQPV